MVRRRTVRLAAAQARGGLRPPGPKCSAGGPYGAAGARAVYVGIGALKPFRRRQRRGRLQRVQRLPMPAAEEVRALVHKLAAPVEHELDRGRIGAPAVLVLARLTVHGP
jgi:hypothetical protein